MKWHRYILLVTAHTFAIACGGGSQTPKDKQDIRLSKEKKFIDEENYQEILRETFTTFDSVLIHNYLSLENEYYIPEVKTQMLEFYRRGPESGLKCEAGGLLAAGFHESLPQSAEEMTIELSYRTDFELCKQSKSSLWNGSLDLSLVSFGKSQNNMKKPNEEIHIDMRLSDFQIFTDEKYFDIDGSIHFSQSSSSGTQTTKIEVKNYLAELYEAGNKLDRNHIYNSVVWFGDYGQQILLEKMIEAFHWQSRSQIPSFTQSIERPLNSPDNLDMSFDGSFSRFDPSLGTIHVDTIFALNKPQSSNKEFENTYNFGMLKISLNRGSFMILSFREGGLVDIDIDKHGDGVIDWQTSLKLSDLPKSLIRRHVNDALKPYAI